MTHVRLVCLDIEDAASYRRYRVEMQPLLEHHGGRFLLDADVEAVTINPAGFEFRRVLLIAFPEEASSDAFFGDADYGRIKSEWFTPAVRQVYTNVLGAR